MNDKATERTADPLTCEECLMPYDPQVVRKVNAYDDLREALVVALASLNGASDAGDGYFNGAMQENLEWTIKKARAALARAEGET